MKVLVVVDAQKDFIDGVLGTAEAQAAVPVIEAKIAKALEDGVMVMFTQDTHFDNYMDTREGKLLPVPHCIEDTDGWKVDERLDIEGAPHIEKFTFGAYDIVDEISEYVSSVFSDKSFGDIESIEFCGFCTDICVISNVLMVQSIASILGVELIVDSKACAGVTPQKHEAALEVMRSCQVTVI